MEKAHAGGARDVDCAPRQQHLVATCGDDAKLRLWDLRCARCGLRGPTVRMSLHQIAVHHTFFGFPLSKPLRSL